VRICALQLQACVEKAIASLQKLPNDRVCRIKYENLVNDPVSEFRRIAEFIEKPVSRSMTDYLIGNVSPSRQGKGRSELEPEELSALQQMIGQTLVAHGYN
jgi:hypothetical protein